MGHVRFLKNVTLNLKDGGVANYPVGRFAKVDKLVYTDGGYVDIYFSNGNIAKDCDKCFSIQGNVAVETKEIEPSDGPVLEEQIVEAIEEQTNETVEEQND